MKKKVTGIALIALAFLSGFLINGLLNMESSVKNADVEERIAIVNNDNSVITEDGESINYGQYFAEELFNTERSDVYFDSEIVSMDIAEEGLEGTRYSGYILFPEDFSEDIISMNTEDPTQSLILYKLNNTLYEDGKELTEKTILNEIYYVDNQINYLYIKDQFEELANTQDSVEEISDVALVEGYTIDTYAAEIDNQFELYAEQINDEEASYNEERETIALTFEIDSYEPVDLTDSSIVSEGDIAVEDIGWEPPEFEDMTIEDIFIHTDENGVETNASDEIYGYAFNTDGGFQNTIINFGNINDYGLTSESADGTNEYNNITYFQDVSNDMKNEFNVEIDLLAFEDIIDESYYKVATLYSSGVVDYTEGKLPLNEVFTSSLDSYTDSYSADFYDYLEGIGYLDDQGQRVTDWYSDLDYSLLGNYCSSSDDNPIKDYSCDMAKVVETNSAIIDKYVDLPRYNDGTVAIGPDDKPDCSKVQSDNIACTINPLIDDYYINAAEEETNKDNLWDMIKKGGENSSNTVIHENIDDENTTVGDQFIALIDDVQSDLTGAETDINQQVNDLMKANIASVDAFINGTVDEMNAITDNNNAELNEMFTGEDCAMCIDLTSTSNTSNVTNVYNDLLASYANTNTGLNESYNEALEPFYSQLSEYKTGGQINSSHLSLIANPIEAEEEENDYSIIQEMIGENVSIFDILLVLVIILAIIGLIVIRFLGKKHE